MCVTYLRINKRKIGLTASRDERREKEEEEKPREREIRGEAGQSCVIEFTFVRGSGSGAVWIFNSSICRASIHVQFGEKRQGVTKRRFRSDERHHRRRPIRIGLSCTERQTAPYLVWQRVSARQTHSICLTVSRYLSSNSDSHTYRGKTKGEREREATNGDTRST